MAMLGLLSPLFQTEGASSKPLVTTLVLDGTTVVIEEIKGRKQATGKFQDADGSVLITMPLGWPLVEKARIARQLTRRLLRQRNADTRGLSVLQTFEGPHLTLTTQAELWAYTQTLNEDTLNATIAGVRIGSAKKTRLAQINLKTRVITVSKYCLMNVPESALQYLLIHELCHTLEANHSRRFWGWVAHYHPTYREDAKLIRLVHQRNQPR
jgi:predicted metal-dependent hydrolase